MQVRKCGQSNSRRWPRTTHHNGTSPLPTCTTLAPAFSSNVSTKGREGPKTKSGSLEHFLQIDLRREGPKTKSGSLEHFLRIDLRARRSLTGKKRGKKKCSGTSFPKKACGHSMCSTMVGGVWRLAVGGGWQLAVGNWRLVAVGGGWRRLVVGDWWLVAVGSGWQLAVGRCWRLAVVGGWRLVAVGGWRLVAVGGWQLVAVGG